MKKAFLLVVVVGLFMTLLGPAQAGHRSTAYCSESGDICQSTRKVDGVRKLRIATAAKYFGRYRLCVTAPDDSTACRKGRMRKDGSIYRGAMRWRERFSHKGPGAYVVKWKFVSGGKIGRTLGFHV